MAQERYLGETGLRRLSELIKEDLSGKANLDGSYDSLQAGSAKQLVSSTGVTDTSPYIFRTTAGSKNVSDGLAELKSIRGRTIVWNQLVRPMNSSNWYNEGGQRTFDEANNSTTSTNDGSTPIYFRLISTDENKIQFVEGHKYILRVKSSWTTASAVPTKFRFLYLVNVGYIWFDMPIENWKYSYVIFTSPYTANARIGIQPDISGDVAVGDSFTTKDFNILNLTQIYGAGYEPTSVSQFIRDYPKLHYGFDAGTIKNVQLEGKKSVGYNAFDGELEACGISNDTGENNNDGNNFRTKNHIKVIPGENYTFEYNHSELDGYMYIHQYDESKNLILSIKYIASEEYKLTLENNTCYVRVHWYKSDSNWHTNIPTQDLAKLCIHLTHSGSRTGFEPYEEHILRIDTAQYFPDGMNGVGTAYDELTPKQAIKRMGMVDLGTLNWAKSGEGTANYRIVCGFTEIKRFQANEIANIICAKYATNSADNVYLHREDKTISSSNLAIQIYDSDFIDENNNIDLESWKASLSGVYLYYELATPEITEIPQTKDINWAMPTSDYGTEEHLLAIGHEVPVPHETFYMDNLRDKLRNLPEPSEYQALKEDVESLVRVPALPTDTSKSYVLEFTSGTIKWTEKQQ